MSDRARHLRAGPAGPQPQHPVLHPAASWDPRLFRNPLPAPAGEWAPAAVCLSPPSIWTTPENVHIVLNKFMGYVERLSKSDMVTKAAVTIPVHFSCKAASHF